MSLWEKFFGRSGRSGEPKHARKSPRQAGFSVEFATISQSDITKENLRREAAKRGYEWIFLACPVCGWPLAFSRGNPNYLAGAGIIPLQMEQDSPGFCRMCERDRQLPSGLIMFCAEGPQIQELVKLISRQREDGKPAQDWELARCGAAHYRSAKRAGIR